MIQVGKFDSRADAELARSLLATAGIPCVLAPDDPAGAYGLDNSRGARVLVAESDADDAALILLQLLRP